MVVDIAIAVALGNQDDTQRIITAALQSGFSEVPPIFIALRHHKYFLSPLTGVWRGFAMVFRKCPGIALFFTVVHAVQLA